MDKNVVIAVGLSFVIIGVFSFLQIRDRNNQVVPEPIVTESNVSDVSEVLSAPVSEATSTSNNIEIMDSAPLMDIRGETELFNISFSTAGAVITSLELKEHMDGDNPVNMVYPGDSGRNAFEISFGENFQEPIEENFHYNEGTDPNIFQFFQTFQVPLSDGTMSEPFKLTKTYKFIPDEYMMELVVTIENSRNEIIPLNYGGLAYTISYGPQIGPSFTKLDGRYSYRKLVSFYDGSLTTYSGKNRNNKGTFSSEDFYQWAGVIGKYFGVVVITDSNNYKTTWSNEAITGLDDTAFIHLSRSTISSSNNSDTYRFYIGPKDNKILELYNNSENNFFGYSNLNLESMIDSNFLGFLQVGLKWILEAFYWMIPNYGIAIILMTLLIKILLFPITHKSYESTSKMSAIQPKMKELQDKYKNDPQRLNKEMTQLYQREGVNPMGGCLPMVLQMPILFSVYGMLNRFFDLRGAVFIPGWIDDLSAPESVYTFANFSLGPLGSDIRLLPIIYVASQIFSMKLTQARQPAAAGQNAMQQKMFMYMMPIMFFFILYNVSSGLLIYWIVMNVLTTGQQMVINHLKKKKENK